VRKVHLKLQGGSESEAVKVERLRTDDARCYQVQCRERSAEVDLRDESFGSGLVRTANAAGRFVAVTTGSPDRKIEVWFAGRTYTFETVDQRTRRAAGGRSSAPVDELTAPMPGTILRIEVAAGDAFVAHQTLIIMESMKMEMTLASPHPGRVLAVNCRVGELVPMGRVLAKLEAKEQIVRSS